MMIERSALSTVLFPDPTPFGVLAAGRDEEPVGQISAIVAIAMRPES